MKPIVDIKHFDSPEAYGDWIIDQWQQNPDIDRSGDYNSWAGKTMKVAADILTKGSTEHLARAEQIISQLEIDDILTNAKPIMQSSVVGFVPNVPAVISGRPDCMFNRGWIEEPNAVAPLSVYVETTVSGGVGDREIINRGIAVLAFVLAMESVRPVDLYTITPMYHSSRPINEVYVPIVRVASRPMDLGRAVYMLTSVSYSRRLSHAAVDAMAGGRKGNVNWMFNDTRGANFPTYGDRIREVVSMDPQDVLITGGHLANALMLTDPVQWVQGMINKHRYNQT